MQIHLYQNGQQTGPYSLEDIRARLAAGTLQPTDLAWYEGAADWAPVSSVPGVAVNAPVAQPKPPPFAPSPIRAASTPQPLQPPTTSGLAITSMVLGLLGILMSIFTALPAIICGHIALSQIRRSGGALAGRGLAITGLVTGYLFCAIAPIAILAAIALPVFAAVQQKGLAVQSLSNAKQIALACKLYANDNNGNYPDNLQQLVPKYLTDPRIFVCPMDPDHEPMGYEYFGGKDTDPPDKVLLQSKVVRAHMRVVVHSNSAGSVQRE